jgi:hypothetical protein
MSRYRYYKRHQIKSGNASSKKHLLPSPEIIITAKVRGDKETTIKFYF